MTALRVRLWFWQPITRLSYFSLFFFFYQIRNFLFLLWVNLYMIMRLYLHDPPPFNGPFFRTPPFSESQKLWPSLSFHPPSPSDNFWQVPNCEDLLAHNSTDHCFTDLSCSAYFVHICYSPTGRSVLRETVPEVFSRYSDRGHSFSHYGPT